MALDFLQFDEMWSNVCLAASSQSSNPYDELSESGIAAFQVLTAPSKDIIRAPPIMAAWSSSSTMPGMPGTREAAAAAATAADFPALRPRRPLSAYNLFFRHERQRVLKMIPARSGAQKKPRRSHGKIGFAELARHIAAAWKALGSAERAEFEHMAEEDKERYKDEMVAWNEQNSRQWRQGGNEPEINKEIQDDRMEIARIQCTDGYGSVPPRARPGISLWCAFTTKDDLIRRYSESDGLHILAKKLGWECQNLFIDLFGQSSNHKSKSSSVWPIEEM